ncbi:brevican core protein-like [Centroberyx affinis]|uniref:brevican core protein-like n=1 Tax=Centroberyx affinis TaxID=166261 RepID=UPI003A5C1946
MVLRRIRHVQLLPLLCAVCHLTLAFPAQSPYAHDEVRQLQVNIPHSALVFAPLGSSITVPCLVSLSPTPTSSFSPILPRVKWSVVSHGVEMEILVARGHRVKINEAYRDRAALLNYTSSNDDLSLWLGDLRSSDSGHYRCEVQQGLEDASDLVQLKIKGVVFHYRDALGRYAFSFDQAQKACEGIGAQIATPDQLLAAYYDGYEQCDAGWLADQSVRYPIQVPREGCYGDMDGQPGVRNYGTLDPEDLFDVYCYVEQIDGEVFHDPIPQQLSFDEAQSYCRAAGAELATTGQLYLAWSEGLDRCSPGWLSDGSVRYPILTPRERCGGPQAGVKTLYRFSNQTGFPEPSSRNDVYCFKGNGNARTDSPMDYMATEPEDIGQDVVILMETDEELQLSQHSEQVEREAQSALESLPFFSGPSIGEDLVGTHPTVMSDTTESPLNTTASLDLLQPFDETLPPTEMDYDSQHPTSLLPSSTNNTDGYSSLHPTSLLPSSTNNTDGYNSPHPTSLLPSANNETGSHHEGNFSLHQPKLENTPGFPEPSYEPHRHYQPMPDINLEEHESQLSDGSKHFQPMPETILDFERLEANNSKIDSNHSQEENIPESTPMTLNPMLQMKLEEAVVEEPVQTSLSTQSQGEAGELVTQPAQTTLPIRELTSMWFPLDGSGDSSQESDLDIGADSSPATSESSTSDFTPRLSPSAAATAIPTESQTGVPDLSISSGLQHSEELGLDVYSTTAHPWESSISRQEGSTSLEFDDTMVTMESVSSEEKQLHPSKSEEHLVSGAGLSTTESPEMSNTSQLPTDSPTAGYETSAHRLHVDPTTASHEEGSGHEPTTVTPTLEEEVTVSPLDSQTSNWTLPSTTYGPQESLDGLEYSREPSSTVTPDSSAEPDVTSTEPTAATTTTSTLWSTRTWSPPTSAPKAFHETAEPQKVTALIPPVDQGRVDLEFSLTQPPTLLILPNERAAVDGTGKLSAAELAELTFCSVSDPCLEDPCLNGGTCTEYNGGPKCLCLPSYGGDFCQTDLEQCEPGWDKFHGFCYRHFSQRLSWEVAEQHCRMVGAHLVSIMTPEEQSFINSNYKEYQWTGLNDKTIEEDFRWSDGNPLLYENWYRGQPDSYFLSGEDCVVMVWHDGGRWSDVPCNYHLAYTCKKGTSSCGPPPKVQNTSIFGKVRQRYETDAVVRYYCGQGFQQRQTPLVRCLSGGKWEEPQILCIPEAGGTAVLPGVTSPTTTSFDTIEDESEATKESPQYWDIKF